MAAQYTDTEDGPGDTVYISSPMNDYACIVIKGKDTEAHVHVHEPDERARLARALIGDEQATLLNSVTGVEVNPDDVRVGDLVVVRADNGCVGGEVDKVNPRNGTRPFRLAFDQWWPDTADATVYRLRQAEPDPEQVEAWRHWLVRLTTRTADHASDRPLLDDVTRAAAVELARAGLPVPDEGDE